MTDGSLATRRAEVKAAEARARRKMSRLARMNRADIRGTKLDPLRGAPVEKLTRKQLDARAKRIDAFMDRKVQYYGDATGRLISRDTIKAYRSAIAKSRIEARKDFNRVANIKTPAGITVRKWHEKTREKLSIRAERQRAVRDVTNPRFIPPMSFGSEAKLRKYIDAINADLGKAKQTRVSWGRDDARKMLTIAGKTDIVKMLDGLTDGQFDLLWSHSNFAQNLKEVYANKVETDFQLGRGRNDVVEIGDSAPLTHLINWAGKKQL